jgi:hypothetical protein
MHLSRNVFSNDERVKIKYCVTEPDSPNVLADVATAALRHVGNYQSSRPSNPKTWSSSLLFFVYFKLTNFLSSPHF